MVVVHLIFFTLALHLIQILFIMFYPPTSCMAYCFPHSGSGMMGLINYNSPYPDYREYISSQLNCPMTAGNTYTVSFWINTGQDPVYHIYSMSHLGIYFSAVMPTQTGYNPILVTPHFEITSVITNTVWVQHTFTVTPAVNCNYITIGNFRMDAACSPVATFTSAGNWPYAYWYLDDISVTGPAGSASPIVSSNSVTCNAYSNGSATAAITGSLATTYTWLPSGGNSTVATGLSAGVYTVNYANSCSSGAQTVLIAQPSPLTSALNSFTLLCRGQSIILNANVSGGTAPYTYSWTNGPTIASVSVAPLTTTNYTVYVNDANGCNTMAVSTVSVEQCDGLKQEEMSDFLVYPNPARDKIEIKGDIVPERVIILNSVGKIVFVSVKEVTLIDVSELPGGLYYLMMYKEGISEARKFVISK